MRNVVLSLFTLLFLLSSCKEDTEILNDGKGNIVIKSSTNNEVENIITRTGEEAGYWVTIEGPQSLPQQKVGEGKFSVLSGNYTVTVVSVEGDYESELPKFDLPVYEGSNNVAVETGKDAPVQIKCTQINTGVHLKFDPSVTTSFPSGFKVKIEDKVDASKSIEYIQSGKTGYFMPATLKMTITNGTDPVLISGKESFEFIAKAKQLWTITLKTSGAAELGDLEMEVTVDETTDPVNPEYGIGTTNGTGTETDAYSVSDAINAMPVKGAWVEGSIALAEPKTRSNTSAIWMAPKDGAKANECILVEIPENSILNSLPKGTTIKLKGDVMGDTNTTFGTIASFTNITELRSDDVELLGPNGGEPITVYGQTLKSEVMTIGAMVDQSEESDYTDLLKRDFSRVTAETEMLMTKGQSAITTFVEWAENKSLHVHGRALLCKNAIPASFLDYEEETALNAATKFITNAIMNNPHVNSWDVVTEAYNESGQLINTGNSWGSLLGSDYIRVAFEAAYDAIATEGSNCKLFYDESGLVGNTAKLNAVINAMTALSNADKQLVDGIGVQIVHEAGTSTEAIKTTIDKIVEAGFIVHISSLKVTGDEAAQAQTYKEIFDIMKSVPIAQNWGITLGGVSDQYSGGNALLFDNQNNAKQAYFEAINSLHY